ncbi:hypothetical protein Hanom_Chr04g00307941 [Helianthus anomalus]
MKVELSTTDDLFESIPSVENSNRQISSEIDSLTLDENVASPFYLIKLSSNEESLDQLASAANEQQKLNNSSPHFIARWQVPKSQRNSHDGRHNNQKMESLCWNVSEMANQCTRIDAYGVLFFVFEFEIWKP